MFALNPSICIVHFAKHILAISGPLFLLSSKPVSPAAFFIYSLRSPVKSESCSVLSDSLRSHGVLSPWNSPGTNTGVGSLSCLQGIFPTQGSNPGLPHFLGILYCQSHMGSPRILERVAYPLLQGIFLTQESSQGLLHCRQILYQLSYQGSPRNPVGSSLNSTSPRLDSSLFPLAGLWTHPLPTPASQAAQVRNLVSSP